MASAGCRWGSTQLHGCPEFVHAPVTIQAAKLALFLTLFVCSFVFSSLGGRGGHMEEEHGLGRTGK